MQAFPVLLGFLSTMATAQVAVLCSTATPPTNWTGYTLTFKQPPDYDSVTNNAQYGSKICQHTGALVSNALGVDGSVAVRIEPSTCLQASVTNRRA
ncbi:hypothetical protein C8A03DRAFT_33417 [Achaetomium macrosporum]|uniref:Uncharacterized protein n=1 Tax=Achaetomium macrosporum TaxID=79813 RepID=A0AAN7CAN8_9PEZI|nr:hypothetical protein C8A03DRAFT_33417 [Achaetomium macrosporum]